MKRFFSIFLVLSTLVTLGAGCGGGGGTASTATEKVTLKFWSVFDQQDAYRELITKYKGAHPNVDIQYRVFRPEEYDKELIRALAEGTGPDIFSVSNSRVGEFQGLLKPMPTTLNVSSLVTQGTLQKKTSLVAKQESTPSQKAFKQQFVDVVANDVIMSYQPDPKKPAEQRVFGVPFAVDNLALFYNKDLLNSAGIAQVPANWDDFRSAVQKLTKYDATGGVAQSGAALGTGKNVDRASDIISVLMMQNGAPMVDERGKPAFDTIPAGTQRGIFPGLDAVRFYTDFANPVKDVYTWNDTFPGSVTAFSRGQTAFMLGYSYDVAALQAAAPKLNYAIAPLPQIAGGKQMNIANYWVQGVSKTSKFSDYAWNFLLYASSPANVTSYLAKSGKPTALRSLIGTQSTDEKISVFADQLLTASSWYHGKDAVAAEKALTDLAANVLAGIDKPEDAIGQAVRVVGQTY
ncbi:MAG: extracellular solute-binding protein [Patescibacteria group bacterium]|jgi:multiple sugar transport system substrate-binding protein